MRYRGIIVAIRWIRISRRNSCVNAWHRKSKPASKTLEMKERKMEIHMQGPLKRRRKGGVGWIAGETSHPGARTNASGASLGALTGRFMEARCLSPACMESHDA